MSRNLLHHIVLCLAALCVAAGANADTPKPAMKTTKSEPASTGTELATLGGGCFWCLEAVFERVKGVKAVTSGYAGGKTENPTYQAVCAHLTGHAEVVQIEFNPALIRFEDLLEVFWDVHDPTTPNRQGADVGDQYRSIVLYHNEAQKRAAEKSKQEAARRLKDPIVTEIVPLTKFYAAEDYHQDYFRKNPNAPYCVAVVRPKVEKFLKRGDKH